MTYATPPASEPGQAPPPRALEEVLTDMDSLADELVATAGPDAVAGVGEFAGTGGVVASRLAEAAPRLRALGTRLDTVRLTWLPVIEAEHPWQTSGARTFSAWLARTENVSTTTAKCEARTGRVLRDHLPTTRATALAGGIGADHVRALVDVAPTSNARKAALAAPIEPDELSAPPVTEAPDPADVTDVTDGDEPPVEDPSGNDPVVEHPAPPVITGCGRRGGAVGERELLDLAARLSVNHSAPSGPVVIAEGMPPITGTSNSVTRPSVPMRPILSVARQLSWGRIPQRTPQRTLCAAHAQG
jgi:hypothetical protein